LGGSRAGGVAAIAALALGGCWSIQHTFDDVGHLHTIPENRVNALEHKFEVERYSWLTAQTIWGPLRHIPGLTEQAKRSVERIDDPAQFCFQLTGDFMSVDVGNILDTAETVYWSGAIVFGDPFPLSRIRSLRVLGKVVSHYKPSFAVLEPSPADDVTATDRRLQRLKLILTAAPDCDYSNEQKAEYLAIEGFLASVSIPTALSSRGLAYGAARMCASERDPEIRAALEKTAGVQMVRGALQQLDEALSVNTQPHEQVRIEAARQMVASMGAAAIPRLIEKLGKDPQPNVRAVVAELAGKTLRADSAAPDQVLAYLMETTKDSEPYVCVNAMESLGLITGIGREYDSDWWRQWWSERLLNKGKNP
jgi:hypothetical protein